MSKSPAEEWARAQEKKLAREQEELRALVRDGERYRWLRSLRGLEAFAGINQLDYSTDEQFDATVDAGMLKAPNPTGSYALFVDTKK